MNQKKNRTIEDDKRKVVQLKWHKQEKKESWHSSEWHVQMTHGQFHKFKQELKSKSNNDMKWFIRFMIVSWSTWRLAEMLTRNRRQTIVTVTEGYYNEP